MDRAEGWWRVVGMSGEPESNIPVGCKGAACPAFAICQGRCAAKRDARQKPVPTVREDYSGGGFLV